MEPMHGANTSKVLQEICPRYRLHSQNVSIKEAMEAVLKKRPVVARFHLTNDECIMGDFFEFLQE